MGLRILYSPSPVLRQVSKEIENIEKVWPLVDDLKDAIRYKDKVWTGTGLSICGVQIGVPYRVVLIGRPLFWKHGLFHKGFDVMINPEILSKSAKIEEDWEGCLSFPNTECLVPRYSEITLTYQTLSGAPCQKSFSSLISRVLQHEIDHLNGILMTDKATNSRPKVKSQKPNP